MLYFADPHVVNAYLTNEKVPANGVGTAARDPAAVAVPPRWTNPVHGFLGYSRDGAVRTLRQVLDGQTPVTLVHIIPGIQARYSGDDCCVLQQLPCDVTWLEFDALMRMLVLEPIGMAHSTYTQPLRAALQEPWRAGMGCVSADDSWRMVRPPTWVDRACICDPLLPRFIG